METSVLDIKLVPYGIAITALFGLYYLLGLLIPCLVKRVLELIERFDESDTSNYQFEKTH